MYSWSILRITRLLVYTWQDNVILETSLFNLTATVGNKYTCTPSTLVSGRTKRQRDEIENKKRNIVLQTCNTWRHVEARSSILSLVLASDIDGTFFEAWVKSMHGYSLPFESRFSRATVVLSPSILFDGRRDGSGNGTVILMGWEFQMNFWSRGFMYSMDPHGSESCL